MGVEQTFELILRIKKNQFEYTIFLVVCCNLDKAFTSLVKVRVHKNQFEYPGYIKL